ncbi:hypothetical protein [Desulfobacula sp.]|uniref:hypothetical protein n=1 Tax=Desulfobacula sp. TaxID=2593537 RepID=UPI0025C0095A|nr:hypothetical protein [Desulfobacula sp.]MBC2702935.1 hypothetical protein [Desulfobacula sp.]
MKNKNTKNKDPLISMLNAASKDDLIELIKELMGTDLSIRRICINHLKEKVTVSSSVTADADSSVALTLWHEVEPELSELDEYGGGDYSLMEDVGEGLYELYKKLKEVTLTDEDRYELLNEVMSYIESGNAGMDDSLYDIAYALCKNDESLKELAERFENLKRDWPIENARGIYRRIGEHKKYLELRLLEMKYGMDYYDLASYYWETGEKSKAVETAQKGMKFGQGRMDELKIFLAERAKEAGDRDTYLEYYFSQKTDSLTLSSYKEIKKECKKEEWGKYEPKLLKIMKKNFNIQAVKIHLYRQEYEAALQYFKKDRRLSYYGSHEVFSVAEELENRYPEQILRFYKLFVGNLNTSATRKTYSENAVAVARVRRVIVDVMEKTDKWKKYALPIKLNNDRRPAFQDEFERVIPDWKSL